MKNKLFFGKWFTNTVDFLSEKFQWGKPNLDNVLVKMYLYIVFPIIILVCSLYFFGDKISSPFLKEKIVFLTTNTGNSVMLFVAVNSLVIFLINLRFSSPDTWRGRRLAFFILFTVLLVDIFYYRPHWNLAPAQEAAIRSEERKRTDSILESWKRDDTRESKIAKKEKEDYEKQLFRVRQSLDSTVGASLSKDQKISSLNGVLASLRSTNRFLDSLNNVKKDPVVLVRESDASPPSPPPPVKRGPKKGVPGSTREEPKIHWVKASYKKPPGAFKN